MLWGRDSNLNTCHQALHVQGRPPADDWKLLPGEVKYAVQTLVAHDSQACCTHDNHPELCTLHDYIVRIGLLQNKTLMFVVAYT